ncbi:hypothetical protein CEP54_009460 [Fusarium duplospermum]|uniref:Uncharacterized protein n=1 Tax=Fusarium duplospermum TaxID=1325734 RepID=A0A428PQ55_9HYPO|nr:hypothetical protein CEP54_009460 [Fusarium duplospermum]
MSFDQATISAAKRFNEAMEESQRLKKKKDIHRAVLYGSDRVPPASLSLQEREKVTRALVKTNTDIKARDKEMVELVEKIAKA